MKNSLKMSYVGEDLRKKMWPENLDMRKPNKMLKKNNSVSFSLYFQCQM